MAKSEYPVTGNFDNGTDVSRKVSYGDTGTNDASKGGAREFVPHPAKPEQYKTDNFSKKN
ncbi:MAG: hypothetical protein WCC37_25180 [Candidatus Sulfotelmatobacter sp.]|jgi:hypothetical protein